MIGALTGLRAFAAAVVFVNHIGYLVGHTVIGDEWRLVNPVSLVGVFTFFALSGYLLAMPGSMRGGRGGFWRRRAARILPVYWVTLAAVVGLIVTQGGRPGPVNLLANVLLLQSWSPSGQAASLNLPSWSLSVEVLFYATLPLVIAPTVRLIGRWPRTTLAAVVLLAIAGSLALQGGVVSEVFPPAYLPIFFLGVHAAVTGRAVASPGLAWVAFVLGAASYPFVHNYTPPALGAALLVASLAKTGGPAWIRTPTVVRFGTWSYAFFLVHVLVISVVGIGIAHTVGRDAITAPIGLGLAAAAFVASWVAAALLYHVVEEPGRRWLAGAAARSASPPERAASPGVFS